MARLGACVTRGVDGVLSLFLCHGRGKANLCCLLVSQAIVWVLYDRRSFGRELLEILVFSEYSLHYYHDIIDVACNYPFD